jgi:RAB protein geranylgeranyltransferase component A
MFTCRYLQVPLSKSDVFQATDLSFGDKRQLMKLVQLVSAHDPEAKQAHNASAIEKLSDESKQLQGKGLL